MGKVVSTYPIKVCLACGIKHGFRSVKIKTEWTRGECDVCREECEVTSPDAFGHLRGTWEHVATTTEIVAVKTTHSVAKAGVYSELG